MAVVAAVAVGLGYVAALPQRAVRFDKLAYDHLKLSGESNKVAGHMAVPVNQRQSESEMEDLHVRKYGEQSRRHIRLAIYHYKMFEKYLRASNHSWLPVWPDPPEPK
jgi:hypothetical protein